MFSRHLTKSVAMRVGRSTRCGLVCAGTITSHGLHTPLSSFTTSCGALAPKPVTRAAPGNDLDSSMPHSDHFDVQDIDANRLTHYYWDKDLEEDVLSPYDYALMLDEMNEWDSESIQFVEIDDRELLNEEYLR